MSLKETAFGGAGKVAGMEIWRIESLKPVKQPKVNNNFKSVNSTFPCFNPHQYS